MEGRGLRQASLSCRQPHTITVYPLRPQPKTANISRRHLFLLGSAAFLASSLPALSRAAATGPVGTKFLDVSKLLINHELSPAVGGRIAGFAQTQYPQLEPMLDEIARIAAARGATRVEEFFDDLPEGGLRDFAYWVISAWYTGSSSGDRGATLFTYEEALLYQPTIDMVPIPTFGFSAPNMWGEHLYPLTDMPRF